MPPLPPVAEADTVTLEFSPLAVPEAVELAVSPLPPLPEFDALPPLPPVA